MALIVKDRVQETTTTSGTGTITLAGAVSGFQSFAAIGNGNTTYYTIVDGTSWEVGIGTYTSAGTTLSRDTVLSNSLGTTAKISLSGGTAQVFVTYAAGKSVYADASGYVSGYTIENSAIGATTASTGKFTSVTTPSVTATTTDLTLSAISTGKVNLNTLNGTGFQVNESFLSGTSANYVYTSGRVAGSGPVLGVAGSDTNTGLFITSKGTGSITFTTNNGGTNQFIIANTASAVNYVQVTGAATGGGVTLSAQGSDSNVSLTLRSKGSNEVTLGNGNTFRIFSALGASGTNYPQTTSSATGQAIQYASAGSDTNISMAFQPKGTGAIDLAAGSSGVNISNGGTVTAITRTATGSGYTTFPTGVISAPTTAGGVQAVATVASMVLNNPTTIGSGGTGYTVGDTLTIVGGTLAGGSAGTYTVTSVSAGVVTGVTVANFANYSVLPTNPVSTTGGTGTGCTLNATYGINASFTISNAGSGYIEQPTVTFSGGGGSGAAAYATVGSNVSLKTLGTNLSFNMPGGEQVRIGDTYGGGLATNYLVLQGRVSNSPVFSAAGVDTNIGMVTTSKGTGSLTFWTANFGSQQFQISHTASAVNYVQVTGAATTARPAISMQGSDTNISMTVTAKGTGNIVFNTSSGVTYAVINSVASGVNYPVLDPSVAGSPVTYRVTGGDTNIDLALTPKGTGGVAINSAIKLGAGLDAGTSGYVLTSAGAGASPTWSAAGAGGGGLTSLGTITLSGVGNQFSLASLTLTTYKQLYVVFNTFFGGGTNTSISNTTGDQQSANIMAKCGAANGYAAGTLSIDLTTGIFYTGYALVSNASIASPAALTSTTVGQQTYGPTAIGTATTTIYVYVQGGATKSGTITIYGVK